MARHRRTWMWLPTVVALNVAAVALAQESPTTLTPSERACQTRAETSVQRFTRKAVHCLEDCYSQPGRLCEFSFLDAQTLDCFDRARSSAAATAIQNCSGFACPECYGGLPCNLFLENILQIATFLLTDVGRVLLCDDALSPDGLSKAERRCQLGLLGPTSRLASRLSRCLANCRKRASAGKVDPVACAPFNVDGPEFDPVAQACIDKARENFDVACADKCADPPECLELTCEESRALVGDQVLITSGELLCFDAVCGDGQVTAGETCDHSAEPNGCADGLVCLGCAFCTESICGDGVVSPPEECDPFAFPTCDPGLVCRGDCTCATPQSFCVPTSPDTCTSGFTGCFEPCDNFTLGSACVSTTEGVATCVQQFCTFIECTSSADCGPDAVCFTEGCCGFLTGVGMSVEGSSWGGGAVQ